MKIIYLLLFTYFNLFAHDITNIEKQLLVEGSNLQYIQIGLTHMLSGYDHILFVVGILIFVLGFKEMLKLITLFTLGHSISLIFATYNAITINYFLVDAIIGLSVFYIGYINLKNIQFKYFSSTIFLFGLIHGMGLSTRLQQLPLDMDNLLSNIISFNIGIELGQIIILCIVYFILHLLRNKWFIFEIKKYLNYLLIIMGIVFFIIQLNEYYKENYTKEVWKDTLSIVIPANSDKEYKVWIEENKKIQYSWKSDIALYYDFHGEPAADTSGYFKSYKEATSKQDKGELVAPFLGTHGWYWKNITPNDVHITLKIDGEYKLINKTK